jgi:hypothetical protein
MDERLKSIIMGDTIEFMHDGRPTRGEVTGWVDRYLLRSKRPVKCLRIAHSSLWVPVGAVLSRTRRGERIVFEEDVA